MPPASGPTHRHRPAASVPPLVSCIMPTRGREPFVLRSIELFTRQDYPKLELIVLDDGVEGLSALLPRDPRIRYLRTPSGCSIGTKRNLGLEAAMGDIVVHWDDDDWYAPRRVSTQVAPILSGNADITALKAGVFFELEHWRFWRVTPELHRRLFVGDVHGGTLVYHRRVAELARFPDSSLAEDASFLRHATRRGARLKRLENDELFVYLRHGTNAWSFSCGQFLDPAGWQEIPEPNLPADDRAFYAERSPATRNQGETSSSYPGLFSSS